MNTLSLTGALIITLSFLAYGLGNIAALHFKVLSTGVLTFISLGVFLDFVAVAFMVAGSQKTHLSLHSILSASALFLMMINVWLIWRLYFRQGLHTPLGKPMTVFLRIAYVWWVVAYLTGSLLVLW